MPNWSAVASASWQAGLYLWVGGQLERWHAQGDPRETFHGAAPRPGPVPAELANFRAGQPVTVPAWLLDGWSARGAEFLGVVPTDRAVRARAYTVGPDDTAVPVS